MPLLKEWHSKSILKQFNNVSWNASIIQIHNDDFENLKKSPHLRRLVFDEIIANFLISSQIRKKIKKIKKKEKKFLSTDKDKYLKKLNFKLTNDQMKAIDDINSDLQSRERMFRLIQETLAQVKHSIFNCCIKCNKFWLSSSINGSNRNFIKQHYDFAKKFFGDNIEIELLTGKTDYKSKKIITENLKLNKTKLIIGTHALFKKIIYKNLD